MTTSMTVKTVFLSVLLGLVLMLLCSVQGIHAQAEEPPAEEEKMDEMDAYEILEVNKRSTVRPGKP